jgi:hypothetical protein
MASVGGGVAQIDARLPAMWLLPHRPLASLLQKCTLDIQSHLTIATDLSCPVTIVTMRHSSNGRPQHQRPMKLVATGKRLCHLCPSLLRSTVATGNDDVSVAHHYCEI